MKNYKFLFILLIACISLGSFNEARAQQVNVSLGLFQNNLSPYGTWMNHPRFGQVWTYNDPAFRPYSTNGHWDYTNYGWTWVSDFDWGWAPFHYGRWEYDPYYGWMWIPGYEWSNAWVSWSEYDGYYGWAPLGYGSDINVSFGSIPYDRWTFIPRERIYDRDMYRYHVSADRDRNFRNAVPIHNYYEGNEGRFERGPRREEVERYTHNPIQERRIDYNQRPQDRVVRDDRNSGYNSNQQRAEINNRDQYNRNRNNQVIQSPDNRRVYPNGYPVNQGRDYNNPNIPQRNDQYRQDQQWNKRDMNRNHDNNEQYQRNPVQTAPPVRQDDRTRQIPQQQRTDIPQRDVRQYPDQNRGYQRPVEQQRVQAPQNPVRQNPDQNPSGYQYNQRKQDEPQRTERVQPQQNTNPQQPQRGGYESNQKERKNNNGGKN